jgi:hypothetical protein
MRVIEKRDYTIRRVVVKWLRGSLMVLALMALGCSKSGFGKNCESDEDCEGDRVCENKVCVDPDDVEGGDGGSVVFEPKTPVGDVDVDIVDMLFVIENGGEISEEQEKLRQEFPRLIQILASGDLDPDDGITTGQDFRPVKSLHVAVVSSDMGLPGVPPEEDPDPENRCEAGGYGDDGKFQSESNPADDPSLSCAVSYPPILVFKEGGDVNKIANDLACIAALGMNGCGYEMQLEASLKALWPSSPENLSYQQKALGITFFNDSASHCDSLHKEFLRGTVYHPSEPERLSVLAIVVVTEEDDCSAGPRNNFEFLYKSYQLPGSEQEPAAYTPVNLRCYYDSINGTEFKYPVERYVSGFKALREGYEQLVVFAAITGIPPEIDESAYDSDNDGIMDSAERDHYYDAILGHTDMQERIRTDGIDLEPVCTAEYYGGYFGETVAKPARRIVQVARGFGENGVVRSICQQNFTSAMDAVIQAISRHLASD